MASLCPNFAIRLLPGKFSFRTFIFLTRVVPIERKSIFVYLRFHQKKIFKMDHFQIWSERPKVFIFEHFGTNGLKKI